MNLRCGRCHRPMLGTTAYDGACACGGLIEVVLMPTRVFNIRSTEWLNLPESERQYIGRGVGGRIPSHCDEYGYWGNSHPVGYCELCEKTHVRGEAVEVYKDWLTYKTATDPEFVRQLIMLRGKALGCFCVKKPWKLGDSEPNVCHGQIIAQWLDEPNALNGLGDTVFIAPDAPQ